MNLTPAVFSKLPEYFYRDISEKIFSSLKQGGSIQFVGLKGFGKTLLLRNLEMNQTQILKESGLKNNYVYLCELNLLLDGSTASILKHIFGKMLGMDKLLGLDDFGITAALFKFFEDFRRDGKTVILILDSMEKLESCKNKEVYGFLYALYKQNVNNLRFIFSFEKEVDIEYAKREYGELGRLIVGEKVYMRRMNLQESRWFLDSLSVLKHQESNYKAEEKLILENAGGIMFSIKRLYEALLLGQDINLILKNPSLLPGLTYNYEMMISPLEQGTLDNLINNNLTQKDEENLDCLRKYDLIDVNNQFYSEVFENFLKNKFSKSKTKFQEDVGGLKIDVRLTSSEYKILELLNKNKGNILSREEIINYIWGQNALNVSDHALDQIILRLRKKLQKSGSKLSIETLRGRGHRLLI